MSDTPDRPPIVPGDFLDDLRADVRETLGDCPKYQPPNRDTLDLMATGNVPITRTISALAKAAHRCALEHGWHTTPATFADDPKVILSWLMLIVTEVAEAAEAVRHGNEANFAEELADVVIRVFDTSEALGIDIEAEIVKKMATNEQRPIRHGGKRA